jgi:alkylhydroperoxidase family enzyme
MPAIQQCLARVEEIDGALAWWVAGKKGMALNGREQELVILRMGQLYESDYVWRHHVKVGREFGITTDELAWLRSGTFERFPDREQTLLVLTDALVNERTIPPSVWALHGCRLSPRDLLDLIALVSQYVLFALTNNALQVPLEPALEAVPGLDAGTGSGEG